ncbi:MAG: hypothetical protein KO202_05665, partial [Methanobacteriaceae archaeon]|nr:hypothetical protein [Methanobacteriaceae archaeon]
MKKYSVIGLLAVFMLIAGAYAITDNITDIGTIKVQSKEQYLQEKFGSVYEKSEVDSEVAESQELKTTPPEKVHM